MEPLEADDPRTIGEYRLLRRIGSGGMGRVYLGRSTGGRTVAVKVVHRHFAADVEFRVRFRREVDSARRVGGTWTAPVLDADPDAPVPWVATGYVAGPSLQQAVAEHGPLPESTVRALGAGLARALAAVHGLDLVHRDVKPSNVLLALEGPRLIDFGIARATDGTSALTSTGVSIGSPGYMSPEQVLGRGGVTAASDVFSLGAVLAYAATGAAPFPGDSSAALLYHVVHEEPDLSGLGAGPLRELIAACLAKQAVDRPAPEAVLSALAGQAGPAGLLDGGWLPAPLVEQVSRSAVALLDMEPAIAGTSGPPGQADPSGPPGPGESEAAVSGLVPFTSLTPTGHDPASGAARDSGFGPHDPSYDGYDGHGPREAEHAQPAPRGIGRGRLSVAAAASTGSDAATNARTPAAKRPARQVSCTLVLSVAGVLAAALLSAGLVFDLLPGGGTDQNAGDTANPPAAAQSPSSDEPQGEQQEPGGDETDGGDETGGGAPGTVPEAFLGTWKGQLATDEGLPAGIMTVTVDRAEPGDQVATGRFETAIVGERCRGEWTLKSVTEKELRVFGSSFGDGGRCTGGESGGVFRLLPEGGLHFQSAEEAGGNAAGTLRKVD